ncbi:MAG: VOC family protein, partial [Bacteroidales bacterium]
CKIKCSDITSAYRTFMRKGLNVLNEPITSPWGKEHFFVRDPWGNLFDIEEDHYVFVRASHLTGGGNGVTLGVTEMDHSLEFYRNLLDYDTVVSDTSGVFEDLNGIPGSENTLRRVLLKRSKPLQGPMSELMGTSHLELIQTLSSIPSGIYEGRMWGDPGFIHLCFDIRNMDTLQKEAETLGHPFVCDSGSGFDMGDANGHFSYVEDPDGTLIEFVETFRIPVIKRLGLYIDLRNKDDKNPLSRFITKSLRLLSAKPKRKSDTTGDPVQS